MQKFFFTDLPTTIFFGPLQETNNIFFLALATYAFTTAQRVIWTPRTLFFDSLDTQRFRSGFADDDNFRR